MVRDIKKSSNIELLRIISIFMVILSHYYCHSFFPDDNIIILNELIMLFLGSGGKIAVNVFVIISGYFLVTQKFRFGKLFKFFSCTYFWSIAILIFSIVLFGLSNVSQSLLIKAINPLTPLNWFARAYLHLYLIFPLLNRLIYKYSKKTLVYVIGILTVVFFVIPTIRNIALGGYFNFLLIFTDLYFIGAYLRLYTSKNLEKYLLCVGIIGFITMYSSILYFIINNETNEKIMSYPSSESNVFVLLAAVGMFVFF